MHHLLAALIGRPAIQNWRDHLQAARDHADALGQFETDLMDYSKTVEDCRQAFYDNPNKKTRDRWLEAEAARHAAHILQQDIRRMYEARLAAALKDGGPAKLKAALAEVRAELNRRRDSVIADDKKRSEDLGVPISSTELFKSIERELAQCAQVELWSQSDFTLSASKLSGLIGPN